MKKMRLTKAGESLVKKLIFVIVLILVAVGAYFYISKSGMTLPWAKEKTTETSEKTGKESNRNSEAKTTETKKQEEKKPSDTSLDSTLDLAVEPWSGWFAIAAANGDNQTKADSIFGEKGISVNIIVEEDDDVKLDALISGEIDALGTTVNRLAVMSDKISKNNLEVVVPFFTDYSSGGDGIVANPKYTSIESLVDATIGLSKDSVSHAMLGYLVKQSGLSEEDQKKVLDNVITYDGTDEAYNAYFSGKVDVLATWEPYLSKAMTYTNSTLLFSTESTTKLISDCIVVRRDYYDTYPETIEAFVDGCIQVTEDLKTGKNKDLYYANFDQVFPTYEATTEILDEDLQNATLMDWQANKDSFDETAKTIFTTMCEVWNDIGKETVPEMADTIFDSTVIDSLSSAYKKIGNSSSSSVKITSENRDAIIQSEALLNKSVTVNFIANTSNFMDNAAAAEVLNEFVEIAKILDGTIIQIEGNVAQEVSSDADYKLSEMRAETVKQYLVSQGIDASRILTIGNGGDKPVLPNYNADGTLSKEGTDANRRTDIYFKQFELTN